MLRARALEEDPLLGDPGFVELPPGTWGCSKTSVLIMVFLLLVFSSWYESDTGYSHDSEPLLLTYEAVENPSQLQVLSSETVLPTTFEYLCFALAYLYELDEWALLRFLLSVSFVLTISNQMLIEIMVTLGVARNRMFTLQGLFGDLPEELAPPQIPDTDSDWDLIPESPGGPVRPPGEDPDEDLDASMGGGNNWETQESNYKYHHANGKRLTHAIIWQLSIPDPVFWRTLNENLSRALSQTLRHDAKHMHLSIDNQGFVPLSELFAHPRFASFGYTKEHILRLQALTTDAKNRFLFKGESIAARMGQTIKQAPAEGASFVSCSSNNVEGASFVSCSSNARISNAPAVLPVDVPAVLCHGTYETNIGGILNQGVLADGRDSHWQHPAHTKTRGFWRRNLTVSVDILAQKAAQEGLTFYLAENGVYLCKETLPPDYILGWHLVEEDMPYYDKLKEFELEAGGSAQGASRPLRTDTRRVSFSPSGDGSSHPPSLPRAHPRLGLSDYRICKCAGTPTVRLGNVCTRCDYQRATPICECVIHKSDYLGVPPLRAGNICSKCRFERVQLIMPKPFSVFKNTAQDPYISSKRSKLSDSTPSRPQAASASSSSGPRAASASASSGPPAAAAQTPLRAPPTIRENPVPSGTKRDSQIANRVSISPSPSSPSVSPPKPEVSSPIEPPLPAGSPPVESIWGTEGPLPDQPAAAVLSDTQWIEG